MGSEGIAEGKDEKKCLWRSLTYARGSLCLVSTISPLGIGKRAIWLQDPKLCGFEGRLPEAGHLLSPRLRRILMVGISARGVVD